jgi:hypothetical protein
MLGTAAIFFAMNHKRYALDAAECW